MRATVRRMPTLSILPLGVLLLAAACASGEEDAETVASWRDTRLTRRQLDQFIPEGVTPEDSVRLARIQIQEWIRTQAIAEAATAKDPGITASIDFKVEDYRRKLIMHAWQRRLIQDSLRTEISAAEMQAYYTENQGRYVAKESLYLFRLMAVPESQEKEAQKYMEQDLESVRAWAAGNALFSALDSLPQPEARLLELAAGYSGAVKNEKPGKLIRWSGVMEGQRCRYLLRIGTIIRPGEPLSAALAATRVRNDILNERKNTLIQDNEARILREARANGYIVEQQ